MARFIFHLALTLSLSLGSSMALSTEIIVASAANFRPLLKQIKSQFEQSQPHKLKLVFASSGKLYAQINHGAPFVVFLSADQSKPKALLKQGLALPDSRFTYAVGQLVLWSSDKSLLKNNCDPLKLDQIDFQHLALANPKLAPYGRASMQVLARLDPKKTTQARWVRAENINQSYQFIASGNAQLGFIARAQLQQLKQQGLNSGSYCLLASDLYSPIKQDAVILKSSPPAQLAVAQAFLKFLQSPNMIALMQQYGYHTSNPRDNN